MREAASGRGEKDRFTITRGSDAGFLISALGFNRADIKLWSFSRSDIISFDAMHSSNLQLCCSERSGSRVLFHTYLCQPLQFERFAEVPFAHRVSNDRNCSPSSKWNGVPAVLLLNVRRAVN